MIYKHTNKPFAVSNTQWYENYLSTLKFISTAREIFPVFVQKRKRNEQKRKEKKKKENKINCMFPDYLLLINLFYLRGILLPCMWFLSCSHNQIKSNHFYCHKLKKACSRQCKIKKQFTYRQYILTDCTEDNVQETHTYTQYTQCIKTYLVINTHYTLYVHILHYAHIYT